MILYVPTVVSCALPFAVPFSVWLIAYAAKIHIFRLPCFTFRKRERKGTVERIDLMIKIEETCFELLSSDFVRYSRKLIVVFRLAWRNPERVWVHACVYALLYSQPSPFLLSSERERFFRSFHHAAASHNTKLRSWQWKGTIWKLHSDNEFLSVSFGWLWACDRLSFDRPTFFIVSS